jgi:hypothetical protein
MPEEILLPTAYLPPAGYFSLIAEAGKLLLERQENYTKQTYRNRCTILTANGKVSLSVPVRKGTSLKTSIKDAEIDYSKRWQQVHLGAISSAYGRSPYFPYYYPDFEGIIKTRHKFLIDLNGELLTRCLKILNLVIPVSFTDSFMNPGSAENDFRYRPVPERNIKSYIQVFPSNGFVGGLSIIDMIFNTGPEAKNYL